MRRLLTAGIVAAVTAVAMTVPATGLANKGGTPHTKSTTSTTTKPCPPSSSKPNKGKHKGAKNSMKGKKKGESMGKKCGEDKTSTPIG